MGKKGIKQRDLYLLSGASCVMVRKSIKSSSLESAAVTWHVKYLSSDVLPKKI